MRLSELQPDGAAPALPGAPPAWLAFLLRPTGKGDLEAYAAHPLNWSGTPGGARVARGLHGAGGAIASAWPVDLLIGLVMVLTGK
jgi:hypothetical protein